MAGILEEILANKKQELKKSKSKISQADLEHSLPGSTPGQSKFLEALSRNQIAIIAECKKKSPSKGILCEHYDPADLARRFERGGASAISVLTDEKYFGGTLADLATVSAAVKVPILRKDFIIDPYQIYEAKKFGADSFLLLSGVLELKELQEFVALGRSLGMEPLIESHTQEQFARAIESGGLILGVNNRNLTTFATDWRHARDLIKSSGPVDGRILVSESGISDFAQIKELKKHGYRAFLIGETLVKNSDPEVLLRSFIS
jgi:indole-3-glycerol phosphate synthase